MGLEVLYRPTGRPVVEFHGGEVPDDPGGLLLTFDSTEDQCDAVEIMLTREQLSELVAQGQTALLLTMPSRAAGFIMARTALALTGCTALAYAVACAPARVNQLSHQIHYLVFHAPAIMAAVLAVVGLS